MERAIGEEGLTYPVAQDNDYATWTAYGNQYWPAKYLIDARGRVRFVHFGEGSYAETERAIRSLLAEAGQARLGGRAKAQRRDRGSRRHHPRVLPGGQPRRSLRERPDPARRASAFKAIAPSRAAARSVWPTPAAGGSAASPRPRGQDASLALSFQARRVFLVMGSRERPAPGAGAARRPPDSGLARRRGRQRRPRPWSPRSASTGSSTCRGPGATCCRFGSRPASPATPSRSGEWGFRAESTRL